MKRISLPLVFICIFANAELTLEWEVDVTPYLPNESYHIDDYGLLENGRGVLLIQPEYHYFGTGIQQDTYYILVFDKAGSIVYSDNLEDAYIVGTQRTSFFISGTNDSLNAYFLNETNSYNKINVDSQNFPNTYDFDPSDYAEPVNWKHEDGLAQHYCFYRSSTTNRLVFKKYVISSELNVVVSSQTSSGFNQDNFVLNWDSSSGTEYQIQSSTDLTNWVNVGSSIVGTGETMTWANHVTNSQAFYRVVED